MPDTVQQCPCMLYKSQKIIIVWSVLVLLNYGHKVSLNYVVDTCYCRDIDV